MITLLVMVSPVYHVCLLSALLSPGSSGQILACHIPGVVLPAPRFQPLCAHLTRIAPVPHPMPSADYLFFSTAQTAGLGLFSLAHPACCLSSLKPGFFLSSTVVSSENESFLSFSIVPPKFSLLAKIVAEAYYGSCFQSASHVSNTPLST